jgi:hypothetical protein
MNSKTILTKVKQRLNKLSSNDFQNIAAWKVLEAFNKGQIEWCRRNLHGANAAREGDEQSISRIDDLQKLLKHTPALSFTDNGDYFQSTLADWPLDFMRFNRVDLTAINTCCATPKRMVVYLAEESNVDILMTNENLKPGYDWGETFCTLKGNQLNVYHGKEFSITLAKLVYYRRPVVVEMVGQVNVYTGNASTVNVDCEFGDELAELLVDEAAEILAGDIENAGQVNRLNQRVEKNN